MRHILKGVAVFLFAVVSVNVSAQKYQGGIVDKTVAVIGNEVVMISDIESEVQMMLYNYGQQSDRKARCEILENMMSSKLFLMQARVDSLTLNDEMVEAELSNRVDMLKSSLGSEEAVEEEFGKPIYRLRQEWRQDIADQTLTQQMQQEIASKLPTLTPYDVQKYVDSTDPEDLPVVPVKYQLSQICIYPDREAANLAVKERLLSIRERIINGEKFSTHCPAPSFFAASCATSNPRSC